MDLRIRYGILTVAGLALAPVARAQTADSLPPGVTREMVDRGRVVFQGPGLCIACHGPAAKGGIGPDLTDTVWMHGDGSFDALVKVIASGVSLEVSETGQLMPPRGGSSINDDDVRAVAAFVWTLSRNRPGS